MTITEKVAYLRGLAEGMKLDSSTNEGKLTLAIIDTLDDIALTVSDLEDTVAELSAQVDEIDDDLGELEDEVYSDGCDDEDEDFDDTLYEVECPSCGLLRYILHRDFCHKATHIIGSENLFVLLVDKTKFSIDSPKKILIGIFL